jgi:hypothetical protein
MVEKKLHDELARIEVLHRHWNKLSPAERASVAKISPDRLCSSLKLGLEA